MDTFLHAICFCCFYCFLYGEVNPEGRSLLWLTIYRDVSPALLYDSVNRGKPQPGAFALLFRGEEGFKGARAGHCIHAFSGILNREHGVGAGLQGYFALMDLRRQVDPGSGDAQLSASGHGIARINCQVHNHLLELVGIGFDVSEIWFQRSG